LVGSRGEATGLTFAHTIALVVDSPGLANFQYLAYCQVGARHPEAGRILGQQVQAMDDSGGRRADIGEALCALERRRRMFPAGHGGSAMVAGGLP
jgi:hypothetical protein